MGSGGALPADEELVARFSGRLDYSVGQFVGRPHADQWVWDEHLDAILGHPGLKPSVSLRSLLQQVADDDRELAADAFQAAVEHGDQVMVSCRLHAAGGGVRSVLITAEVSDDQPDGQPMCALLRKNHVAATTGPWLVGQVLDLTSLRLSASRAAANHAVNQSAEHRAAIEQAKGIIMVTHRVDADCAFELLRRHSQNTNTKVHDLADHLVGHVTTLHLETARAQVDALLQQPYEHEPSQPTRPRVDPAPV
ncbi:hypothetical protein GCM10022204_24240 [Microlunatus aurantiacus]|uniref:ANTAR domain-containing protein n=1 Tax=Microlunatus aurantiacus TaxID=446786 RepID=A0ABP7DIA5_9ACTN